jgi:photosystem II stability/assembly factor-like uncharacterized protein
MKRRTLATVAAVLISTTVLFVLLCLMGTAGPTVSRPALAAPLQITPTVTLIDPSSAPNDLDVSIVITGTDFVSMPVVYLGDTLLSDVKWVTSTVLRATVPWGMDPGVYTLTASNPDGESSSLTNAFTVTQGIDQWNAGALYGGFFNEVVVNPITPTTVYAVSQQTGLFRSYDSGENWTFVLAGSQVGGLSLDGANTSWLYLQYSGLILRSEDEGETWKNATPVFTATQMGGDCWGQETAPWPVAHPQISGTVFAYQCGSSGNPTGLYKSINRGADWRPVMTGLTDTQVSELIFHPTDPITMYLGTTNGNIFTSVDGGESWSYVAQPIRHVREMAVNPFDEYTLWASEYVIPATGPTVTSTARSTNISHTTWITVPYPGGDGSFSSPAHINFPPVGWGETFSHTVYLIGLDGEPSFVSNDDGQIWNPFATQITSGSGLAFHPILSSTMYMGDMAQGVWRTTNGGTSWQVVNRGLTAMAPNRLATVPGRPDIVYGAIPVNSEGIYKATRGGAKWTFLPVSGVECWGDGCSVLADPFTSNRLYVTDQVDGKIFRSDDGGQTWPQSATIIHAPYAGCLVSTQALEADLQSPGILMAGIRAICDDFTSWEGDIYRSTDYGETWTTTLSIGQVISPVTDIAYDVLTPTIVYAATNRNDAGGMLKSTDGGQTWQPMGETIPALSFVQSIAVEPSPPYRVFAWSSHGDGLYVSEDQGASWTQATAPLADKDVKQILCTPQRPSFLYAAASEGLYRSRNGASGWERASGVLGYVPIYSLATVTATDRVILYAGTTGGYVESGGTLVLGLADDGGTLVNAGVYRYTTQLAWEIYLPLVLKAYMP